MGDGGIAPPFLTLAPHGSEWSVSRPDCYTGGKSPRYLMDTGLGGYRAGSDAVEITKLTYPCRESNPGPSSTWTVATPTEVSRFHKNVVLIISGKTKLKFEKKKKGTLF
jgi:hypothetical protein